MTGDATDHKDEGDIYYYYAMMREQRMNTRADVSPKKSREKRF